MIERVPLIVPPTSRDQRRLNRARRDGIVPPNSRRGIFLINPFLGAAGGGSSLGFFRSITQDHTKIGSADLTNYPVLISVTDATLKSVSNGGHVNRTDGLDIWVSTTSTGATAVPFELVSYDPAAGTVKMWVKGASISHTTDTIIGYLRYGDTSITTDQSDRVSTFASLRAVYHTTYGTNSTTVSPKDATGSHDAILTNTPTAATGKIHQGMNVGGSGGTYPFLNFDSVSGGVLPTTLGNYSYSTWWNAASAPGTVTPLSIIWINKSGTDAFGLEWSHNNPTFIQSAYQQSSGNVYVSAKITATLFGSTWYLICVQWDGTNLIIYLNGVSQASTAISTVIANPGASAGRATTGEIGVLEEVRFATSALGASWALADYNSQNSPATFTTLGAETAV